MLVTKKQLKEVLEGLDIILNDMPIEIKNTIQGEMGIVLEDVGFLANKHKDDIFDLQTGLMDFTNEFEGKLYSVEDDMDEVKNVVEEMEEKLEWYDFDDMQSSISNLEYEKECLEDTVTELEDNVRELEDEVQDLNAEVNELKVLVKTLMNEVAQLKGN